MERYLTNLTLALGEQTIDILGLEFFTFV